MTIYEELVRRVSDGESFYISLEKRQMKIGKEPIVVCNGVYDVTRTLMYDDDLTDINTVLLEIEHLYQNYKYSLPSERSDNKRKKYFKALSINDITDNQLMMAERREVAQAKLEGFILCAILSGKFKWTEELGNWFYQSKIDPDLVILRSWIENN